MAVLLAAQNVGQRCILLQRVLINQWAFRGGRAQYNNLVADAGWRSTSVREIGRTEAQLNPTVVHFIELCARYLTCRVYQIIETA